MDTTQFDTPELRQALRDGRLGTVVRLYREERGLTQEELGELTGYSRSSVSRIEQGGGPLHEVSTRCRLAAALHIPGAMLGLAAQHWELDQASAGTEGPVDRRELLRGVAAVGAGVPLGRIAEVRSDADQALAYAGTADVTAAQAAAERHSRGYGGRVPLEVLEDLVDETARAAPLLKLHHPESARADLARAVGQLGAMAAIVLHDLGRHDEALQWFTTATTAAERSGDRRLHAWVLARKAMVPLNYGAPQVAAEIAEQARRAAGRGDSAAAALAAAVAARAYASSRRAGEAGAALRDADRIAGRLTGMEAADTWIGYCAQKHHVHCSRAWTQVGDTTTAREHQQAGIALSTQTGMTRTLMQLDAARCTRQDGDPIRACGEAADALAQAPGRYRAGLVHQRAVELYRAVPDDVRRTTQGRWLAEVLAGGDR